MINGGKNMTYFIIRSNADGEVSVNIMDKEDLLEAINPDCDGYSEIEEVLTEENLDDNNDPNYWGDKTLIIKGEIVIPKEQKRRWI